MYASDLEETLYLLMEKSDASRTDPSEFRARMESLRNYGRLPRGRENHATLLTDEHISDSIFGLSAAKPNWAGHAAIILRTLRPVGGTPASFEQAETLSKAVQVLLGNKSARDQLISLTVTTAESATNANGHASLRYKSSQGGEKTAYFVHQMAISLHGVGAEKDYEPCEWLSPAARQLVLNRRYFETLAKRAETVRRLKRGPASDGSEYDASEAEERRLKALGVQNNSRYLNIGVDNQVTWPRTETVITFDRYTMVLLPKTKEHVQSISIDLTANKLSDEDAVTVINRFLSLLCFCDDQFAVAQDGWSGNRVPAAVPRRDLAFSTTTQWLFDRKIPEFDNARRALALYREARNAEQNFLVSYAVLNYYKVIEILYPEGPQVRAWLTKTFPAVSGDIAPRMLARFDEERGATDPAVHIYNAYRIAVAHASPKQTSDPDVSGELTRLYTAAEVLRPIARHFIKDELAVSDSPLLSDGE